MRALLKARLQSHYCFSCAKTAKLSGDVIIAWDVDLTLWPTIQWELNCIVSLGYQPMTKGYRGGWALWAQPLPRPPFWGDMPAGSIEHAWEPSLTPRPLSPPNLCMLWCAPCPCRLPWIYHSTKCACFYTMCKVHGAIYVFPNDQSTQRQELLHPSLIF